MSLGVSEDVSVDPPPTMYAALRNIRSVDQAAAAVAADAAADNDDDESEQNNPHHDKCYSDLLNESQPERKRKDDSSEPSSSPGKISKQEETKKLPPKKLNPDGWFGDPAPKHQSSGRIPQPWRCPVQECSRNNFQWRKTCPHCGHQKPPGMVSFIVVPPKPVQESEKVVANHVQSVGDENTVKTVRAVKPPDEVSRAGRNNPNLEGLGQRRGGRGRDGSGGVNMAERLAKMAGMTVVPDGFGKKVEEEKSWADIKNKKIPSLLEKEGGLSNGDRDNDGASLRGRGSFQPRGGVGSSPSRGRLDFGDSFGSFRSQPADTTSSNNEPQYF